MIEYLIEKAREIQPDNHQLATKNYFNKYLTQD